MPLSDFHTLPVTSTSYSPQSMQSAAENPYPRSRNPRACEACRINKSRCFASEQPDICQRCLKSRLSCVVRSLARPKRAKALTVPLTEGNAPQPSPAFAEDNAGTVYMKFKSASFPSTRAYVSVLNQHHAEVFKELVPTESENQLHLTPTCSINMPQSSSNGKLEPDEINPKCNLTIDQAEKLLQSFRNFAHYFPFVVIPKDATVKSLSRHSPFLLLAIITAASSKNVPLNCQLDHEFKRVLSEKIICEGRKSLDFLQGLLVYTAWYPCHLRPRNRQIFMYINLAVTLADDLGLGHQQLPPLPICPDIVETEGLLDEDVFSKAARRAYLGCYYLSASVALGLQKPTLLKYSDVINEYAVSISKDVEIWTDAAILTLVKSYYIEEEIRNSLHTQAASSNKFVSSPFQAEMHVQAFHNEVEEWKQSMPSEIKLMPQIVLGERFLAIMVFSDDLAFFSPLQSPKKTQLNPVTLSRCLEATKNFFETLLSLPAQQYLGLTSAQWSHIVIAIIILSRLLFPLLRCPEWDATVAQERAPLGNFLDSLCSKMQTISSTDPTDPNPRNPDGPFVYRMVLESIKRTYEQRLSLVPPKPPTPDAAAGQNADVPGHRTGFNTLPTGMDKMHCPLNDRQLMAYLEPLQFGSENILNEAVPSVSPAQGALSIPLYHDLWATMTMSWTAD